MNRLSRPYERAIEPVYLPVASAILLRFHQEALSDEPSFDVLTGLALDDPALAARLLCAAGTVPFQRDGALRSLRESVQALGPLMLRTMSGCLLAQALLPRPGGQPSLDLAGFRRHALSVGELARDIAFELGGQPFELEEAYLAGLLHDIGELLLAGGFPERYGALLGEARDERGLAEGEIERFETDHATAAAWLVDQWALPSSMADAIAFHHLAPDAAPGLDRLGRILWSAHTLLEPEDDGEASARLLGLGAARLRALAEQARTLATARADEAGDASTDLARPLPPGPGASPGVPGEARLQAALTIPAALQSLHDDGAGSHSQDGLLHCLSEAVRLLFGARRSLFLLLQPESDGLVAAPLDAVPPALRRLRIPLAGMSGLCVDAARERRLIATHDVRAVATLSAIDRQIGHALGAEGLVYVPMESRGALVGVLALGVSPVQLKLLESLNEQLQAFAQAAGRHLAGWHAARERVRNVQADATTRFALQGQRIAHEVGNPLAIIRNYLNLLSDDALASPDRARADIAVLREEIDRLGGIVRQFATGQQDDALPPGQADLNVVLVSLRRLYGEALFESAGMRLDLRLAPSAVPIAADADAVKQVVINLWKNAAQAMGGFGSLVTEVEPRVDHNGRPYAQLRIRDAGPGLPPHVRDTLYQLPTGRTAASRAGDGAGLGLSIVLGLVQGMGGAITCASRPGEGTTFTILIPAS